MGLCGKICDFHRDDRSVVFFMFYRHPINGGKRDLKCVNTGMEQ